MGLMGDGDINAIINLIEAILEIEQYGQLNPDTIELLKADLNRYYDVYGKESDLNYLKKTIKKR